MNNKIKLESKIDGFGSLYCLNHNFSMGFPGQASSENNDCAYLDEALNILKTKNAEMISAKDLVYFRLKKGLNHSISTEGSFSKEIVLESSEIENKRIILKDASVLMPYVNLKEQRDMGRKLGANYIIEQPFNIQEHLEKLVEGKDYINISDISPVPLNRYGEDYRTLFLFEENAKDYGLLSLEANNTNRIFDGFDRKNGSKINQLWLSGISDKRILEAHYWNGLGRIRGFVKESALENKLYSKEQIISVFKDLNMEGLTKQYLSKLLKL